MVSDRSGSGPVVQDYPELKHLSGGGRLEGVLVMGDLRFFGVLWPDDGDDIEASGLVEFVVEFEPCECGAGESLPAATIDGFEGLAIAGGGASFDFGEDGDSAVLSDDVDFAKAIAKAGIENFPAEFSEE